jgi:hydroxymethylglutaryl-CoA reductase
MTPAFPTRPGRGVAPGKVILLGEHAVVYGRAALAAAIDRRIEVRLAPAPSCGRLVDARLAQAIERAAMLLGVRATGVGMEIITDLPAAVGLGSSAALSVALLRALADSAARQLDDVALCACAFEMEKLFHGFPSGIDNTIVTHGGLIRFKQGTASLRLLPAQPLPLVIALGRAPRRTQQTVAALRARWERSPKRYECLFDEVERLVTVSKAAITDGDFETLGAAMDANHGVLRALGVSTDELDGLVTLARAHGALGAKLTGGGGGGAVVCLCTTGREELTAAFSNAGYRAFATTVGGQPGGSDAADDSAHAERHADSRL